MTRARILLTTSLALLVSGTAGGQAVAPEPADYAWGFPILTPESASFYSVRLPLEVNRSVSDPGLRDAGVYNGDGRPVPRVFTPAQDEVETTERTSALPVLPIFVPAGERPAEANVALERGDDSAQFRIDLRDLLAPPGDERLAAYIVDARQAGHEITALDFVWPDSPRGFMGRVIVDGGDDLENWTATGEAVIANLREDMARIVQRRVTLRRSGYDFLRIRWDGMPDEWRLSQVLGVYSEGRTESAREYTMLDSTDVEKADGGRIFNLGGAPMVDQVRVVLPVPNSIISARVYFWSVARERWVRAAQGSYHHIVRDNHSVMSNPLALDRSRIGRFKVVVTQGPADVALKLEVGWRPDTLLFLAQGQPPFTLAAGNARDAEAGFPQQSIYGDGSLRGLAEDNGGVVVATLGARQELGGIERLDASTPVNWQTLFLWLAMLAGVGFVGFMAVRTIGDLRD